LATEAVIALSINTGSMVAILIYILIQLAHLQREDNFVWIALECVVFLSCNLYGFICFHGNVVLIE